MSGGYVKIYGSILDSSVWAEPPATRCVWLALLAMADKDGRVEASPGGLARRANVTEKQLQVALDTLLAADPDSKSPEHEGRRIEVCERGWLILNYLKYRELQTAKQVADAERAQAYRDRKEAERDASRPSQPVAPTGEEAATAVLKSSSSSGETWIPVLEADLAGRLLTDAARIALTGILTVARSKASVVAEINACLGGGRHGHCCSLEEMDQALSDYFGNGMSSGQWNANHFRGCIRSAMRKPDAPAAVRQGPSGDRAQAAVVAIRKLITTNGHRRVIPRAQVEALGSLVAAAYDAVGGADRFLNTEPDKLDWLVKSFAEAMRNAA